MFKINSTENNCNAPEKLSFQLNDINGVCGVPGKLNFEIKDSENKESTGGVVNVFDTDNNLLAEVTAPGQYIVNNSLVTIRRENTTVIVTQSVLSTQSFDYTVNNTELILRDENNNILRVFYLQADSIVDETVFNTTVQLRDSAGNNIGSPNSYLAESSNNLPAPDGTITNSDATYNASVRSGGQHILPNTDYTLNVAGNAPINFSLPTLKNETVNIVWQ